MIDDIDYWSESSVVEHPEDAASESYWLEDIGKGGDLMRGRRVFFFKKESVFNLSCPF